MSQFVREFEEYAASCGLRFNGDIHCDGQLHRINVEGDRGGKKNGWYIFHNEIIPVCIFGTWKGDQKHVWSARHESEMNKNERNKLKAMLREASRNALREREKQYKAVAFECGEIYNRASDLTRHKYLDSKLIKSHPILKLGEKGEMIIPVLDETGAIYSLQYIYPNGRKMFHQGGKTQGCFCPISGAGEAIFICEGYATGATIHEATGCTVYVAFNCNNLIKVAKFVSMKHQKNMIIIAGDDDFVTDTPIKNPGKHHAILAAKSIGASLTFPKFDAYHRKENHTDFNDMHYEGETQCRDNYVRNYLFDELDRLIGGQLT